MGREVRNVAPLGAMGPRASGKTTTALQHAHTVVRLDQPREAEAFRADPDAALRTLPEPVLLDEWQEIPGVLLRRFLAVLAHSTAGVVADKTLYEAAGIDPRTARWS